MPTREEAESLVRSWGFSHVFTWTDGRYVRSPPPFSLQRAAVSHISPPGSRSSDEQLIVSLNSNAHYSPHSHRGLTTHLILHGALTITFADDPDLVKKTYGVGDRIDVEAGRVHEVWMGEEGCEYVIGE